jgi:hypothetical protein
LAYEYRKYVENRNFGGCCFHNNGVMEMAVCEWLKMEELDLYCDRIFKFVPRWDKCISVFRDDVENNNTFVE